MGSSNQGDPNFESVCAPVPGCGMDFTPLESLVQERPEPVLALRKDKFH